MIVVVAVSVVLSVVTVVGAEYLLAYLGVGGSARYERLTAVMTSRVELLIEEVNRLQAQVEITRRDTYPRIDGIEARLSALEKPTAPSPTP